MHAMPGMIVIYYMLFLPTCKELPANKLHVKAAQVFIGVARPRQTVDWVDPVNRGHSAQYQQGPRQCCSRPAAAGRRLQAA